MKAEELYDSPLFKLSLEYAKKQNPDAIYILSAKHYLVKLDEKIDYYDQTMPTRKKEKTQWGTKVLQKLKKKTDIKKDHFIILAGKKYIEPLGELKNIKLPLDSFPIGKRLRELKRLIKEL